MAGCLDESDQIGGGDRGRRLIGQRMAVDDVVAHQLLVEHNLDLPFRVVDQAENGDRSGDDAEQFHQHLRLAEGHPAGGADQLVDLLQVDHGLLADGDEEIIVLLVLEEQVLGMAAMDFAAQRLRIGDRVERRMAFRRNGDAEFGEKGKKFGFGLRHRSSSSSFSRLAVYGQCGGRHKAIAQRRDEIRAAPAVCRHRLAC